MTLDDLEWLREYCLSAASAADAEFCYAGEVAAAEVEREKAAALFGELKALLDAATSPETAPR
jgi:hypothetical protein